jgi:hypothetical protein
VFRDWTFVEEIYFSIADWTFFSSNLRFFSRSPFVCRECTLNFTKWNLFSEITFYFKRFPFLFEPRLLFDGICTSLQNRPFAWGRLTLFWRLHFDFNKYELPSEIGLFFH